MNGVSTTKTYYVTRDIHLTWAHALMFCQSFGMSLVTLPTENEANIFLQHCANSNYLFNHFTHIGGSYIGSSMNNWYWIDDGVPVSYHLRMLPGEPNNAGGRQNCLAVQKYPGSFVFNDIEGYGVYQEKFVCQLTVQNKTYYH